MSSLEETKGIDSIYEFATPPLDVDDSAEVKEVVQMGNLHGLSNRSLKVQVTTGGPGLAQQEGSPRGFSPASLAHMKEVQNLPKQQGGVGMLKKTLFDHAAHAIVEEKMVTFPISHVTAEPKVQWSSLVHAPPQEASHCSPPSHASDCPEKVKTSQMEV